jgi:hypothetical protein
MELNATGQAQRVFTGRLGIHHGQTVNVWSRTGLLHRARGHIGAIPLRKTLGWFVHGCVSTGMKDTNPFLAFLPTKREEDHTNEPL